jgi:hypothetical protein
MSNAQFSDEINESKELFLTQEQIDSGQYPMNEIFEVSFEGQEFGPIWQQDIKEFLQRTNQFNEETKVKAIESDDWVSLFEHPIFQRRRPQLVSTHSLDNEETTFQILIDGQIQGPFTLFEISAMVKTNEVLLTDEVSIDNGQSWGHLYEIEEFDRRSLKSNEELPAIPQEQILNTHVQTNVDEKTNLIAGLAYIGNLKAGKAKQAALKEEGNKQNESEEYDFQAEESKRSYVWPGLFLLSVIGLSYLFMTWNSSPSKVEKEVVDSSTETKNVVKKSRAPIKLKPIKTTRAPRIEKRSNVNSRPTSFKKSKAFRQAAKKKRLSDNALIKENDDYYYDDNTDPVELDPIRSTLSKETIDPAFADEYDDIERAPASDEIFDEEAEF